MDGRGLGGSVLGGQGQARCLEVNPGREESQGADPTQRQAQLLLAFKGTFLTFSRSRLSQVHERKTESCGLL